MRPLLIVLLIIFFGWMIAYYYITIYDSSLSSNSLKSLKTESSNTIFQNIQLKLNNAIEQIPEIGKFRTACDLVKSRQPLDTTHVINPDQYVNTIIPPIDCNTAVYLVVYVHSSPEQHRRRDTIRKTWGNVSQYGNMTVRLVFVIGELVGEDGGAERPAKDGLKKEIVSHGDIVQSNFMDTYRNLSHKAIAGLKWVTKHCRSAKYVLKTDDDAFVNVYLLLHLLRTETNQGHYRTNSLVCNVYSNRQHRTSVNRSGKWATTKEECSMRAFPTFCQGLAFLMTMTVAISLYDASNYVPLLWMDDVYITGFLPALLPFKTVVHLDAETFYMSTWNINNTTSQRVLSGENAFKFIYYHEDNMERIDTAWINLKQFVQTQGFSDYSDALFSKGMELERKRLKDIQCSARRRDKDLC